MLRRIAGLALLVPTLIACGAPRPAPDPTPPPRSPDATAEPRKGWTEQGEASWYGKPYHGRRTASGEVYDMNEMTAAHQTLAFGTTVRVTRLDNRRSVVVRITDRGPFVKDRIIDLSRAAARKLDMERDGIAPVKLEILELPP